MLSGAVAGSIVFFALAGLAIYTIIKKRKERALAEAGDAESSKPTPPAVNPFHDPPPPVNPFHDPRPPVNPFNDQSRPPTGNFQSRPHSFQRDGEMLEISKDSTFVFANEDGTVAPHRAPYAGAYNDKIVPPSPPPSAIVVGTPPYRRSENGSHPGTPTSLRPGYKSGGQSPLDQQGNRPSFPLPDHPLPPPQKQQFPLPGIASAHSSYQPYTPPPGQAPSLPGTPGTPIAQKYRQQQQQF